MRILVGLAIAAVGLGAQSNACLAGPPAPGAKAAPAGASDPQGDLDLPIEGAITNPDWVELPTGDQMARFYPPLANVLAINGIVRMTCEVTKSGMVENCRIASETPKGIGFGEAALQMAGSFRMRPQTVNGAPVSGALVTIPINFKMFGDQPPVVADAAGGPAPSPTQLATARRLAALTLSPEVAKARGDLTATQMQQIADHTPGVDPDQAAKAIAARREAYDAAMPRWRELMAEAYARAYSQAELTQIVAFLETPTGHAWESRSSEIDQAVARSNQSWLLGIQADAHKRFCAQTACADESSVPAEPAPVK